MKNGPRKVLPAERRIRVVFNRTVIIDSTKGSFVWEHDYYPYYYFPLSELKNCTTRDKKAIKSDGVNRASVMELTVSGNEGRKVKTTTTDRVLRFTDDRSLGALTGLVRLEFKAMGE